MEPTRVRERVVGAHGPHAPPGRGPLLNPKDWPYSQFRALPVILRCARCGRDTRL